MLNLNDVLKRYKVSRQTIYNWLGEGRFPKPVRIGETIRWSEKTLDDWEAADCPRITECPLPNSESMRIKLNVAEEELAEDAEQFIKQAFLQRADIASPEINNAIPDQLREAYKQALIVRASEGGEYLGWAFEIWVGRNTANELRKVGCWPWEKKNSGGPEGLSGTDKT